MAIQGMFDSASSIMTLISFITFLGILLWTFVLKQRRDFDQAAALPFADETSDGLHPAAPAHAEVNHG
jgi:cytochrome c oxidase cbb3-type subunit IV